MVRRIDYRDRWYRFAADNGWPICTAVDCIKGVRVGKLCRDPPTDTYDYATNVWPKLRVVDPCVTATAGTAPMLTSMGTPQSPRL